MEKGLGGQAVREEKLSPAFFLPGKTLQTGLWSPDLSVVREMRLK